MAAIYAKYGVGLIITFPLMKQGTNNLAGTSDYTEAAGDVKIIKDGTGGGANATNSMGANLVGNSTIWRLQLTAAEMQAKEIVVKISDHPTGRTIDDQVIIILTYGDPAALWAADLSNSVNLGLSGLPNVQQGNVGALLTSGTGTGQLSVSGGVANANLLQIMGAALTGTAAYIAAAFSYFFGVASPALTVASVNQTGDSFGRIGANGSGLTSLAQASTALSNVTWTAALASYLPNLNVGGLVSSQADVNALNQSAARRIVLTTLPQYERPETGSTSYTIELRTYDGDGAAQNGDTTPTLTALGSITGSLAGNLSAATNPSTGLYRWTYSVANNATPEQIRFDASATLSGSVFTISCYSQVVDLVASTWTNDDRAKLTAVFDKLPSKSFLTGTANSDGDVQLNEATGNFLGSVGSIAGVTFPANFGALGIAPNGHILVVDLLTGHVPQSGDSFALIGANGSGLTALAQAATAVSTAVLTPTRAAALDNIAAGPVMLGTAYTAPPALSAIISGVASQITTDHGLGPYNLGGGGGGAGDGARTLSISVTDGSDPLQSARVRATKGIETYVTTTNASGVATFHLDDGDWAIAITRPGYQSAGQTIGVIADTSVAFICLPVVLQPSEPGRTTGYLTAYGADGLPAGNKSVKIAMVEPPKGSGSAFDATPRTYYSDLNTGLVEAINLVKGGKYEIRANAGEPLVVQVPMAAGEYFQLPNVVG